MNHFLGSLPGPCELTRPIAERIWGPAYGEENLVCSHLVDPGGGSASLWTVEVPLPGTFLIQTVHDRTANQDSAVTTFHYRWNSEDDPVDADYALVEARLNGFWTALKSYRTSLVTGGEHRWYGPFDAPGNHGEAVRVTPVTTPLIGTATSGLPQQVACSVTEITDVRRRWGRFYIPCLSSGVLATPDAAGLFSSTFINAVSAAADTAFSQTLAEWTLSVFGVPTPTSLPVRSIRVDSVPDVQRRRRWDGGTSVTVDVTS